MGCNCQEWDTKRVKERLKESLKGTTFYANVLPSLILSLTSLLASCQTLYFSSFVGSFQQNWFDLMAGFFLNLEFTFKLELPVRLPGFPSMYFDLPTFDLSVSSLQSVHDASWLSLIVGAVLSLITALLAATQLNIHPRHHELQSSYACMTATSMNATAKASSQGQHHETQMTRF